MEIITNSYIEDSIAYKLVESVNKLIKAYEKEGKKISDKDRADFREIQNILETYGNRVVRGKVIELLSAKTDSSYESGLKKIRDSVLRMLSDNNQLSDKFISLGNKGDKKMKSK